MFQQQFVAWRQFIGPVEFYGHFIRNTCHIAQLLIHLLKNNVSFIYSVNEQNFLMNSKLPCIKHQYSLPQISMHKFIMWFTVLVFFQLVLGLVVLTLLRTNPSTLFAWFLASMHFLRSRLELTIMPKCFSYS